MTRLPWTKPGACPAVGPSKCPARMRRRTACTLSSDDGPKLSIATPPASEGRLAASSCPAPIIAEAIGFCPRAPSSATHRAARHRANSRIQAHQGSHPAFKYGAGIFQAANAGDAARAGGKVAGGLHLGAHGARGERHAAELPRRDLADGPLIGRAPVLIDRLYVGQHEKGFGLEFPCQEAGGKVLVDHRLDALQVPLGVADDGDAASPRTDDDHTLFDQDADGLRSEERRVGTE